MAPVEEPRAKTRAAESPAAPRAPGLVEASIQEALHCATSLAQGGDVDEAVDVLRNECEEAPAAALGAAHHAVVEALVNQDRLSAAVSTMAEALQRPGGAASVLPQTQELVLRAQMQAQQHARAAELLRNLSAAGAALPGDAVFNSVVDGAVRARAYGEAWDVLELLLSNGRRADKYFVSILTKSLETATDRRWVRRGINLVDRFIEQQKEDVDEIVFNSLLNVLGHIGDMAKLQQTLKKMTEYNVPPSAVTYGTVVKAYGRARDIDAVLKVWSEMRGRCLGVNPVTCGCVLDACVKCGHLDKAMAIFQDMRLAGLHKNTVLYATLIKGLAKVRDLMGAVHLYQEMRVEGVPCNLVTFNSLMDVCVRCSDLQTAALFLQDMMQMGIEPDLITFSTLIKGYSHTGEVNKALALSKELKQRGLKCDEIMYNSLIDGCAKANKVQEGLMVFDEMLQSRVAPSNITFSILVKLFFEAGQINEAFQVVDEMAGKYRCAPSRIVYTVLLRCCAQAGGPALARGAALLGELASKRNSKMPDQGMLSAVISGCAQHGHFDTALRLVRDFTTGGARRSSGLVPLDCLKTLCEALGAEDEARGQELLEYLRRKSLPAAHVTQLQAALVDGRRRGATHASGPSPYAPGSLGAPGVGQSPVEPPYCQWPQAPAYPPPPYGAEFFPQFLPAGFPVHPMAGYYGGFPPMPYPGSEDIRALEAVPPTLATTPPTLATTPAPLAPLTPVAAQTRVMPQQVAVEKENASPDTYKSKENAAPHVFKSKENVGNVSSNVKQGTQPLKQRGAGKRQPRAAGPMQAVGGIGNLQ